MATMDDNPVIVNISDMIDLAIGTPEVGVVDFGMLQTVLHCLAQQLRILSKNVELRGSVAVLPVGRENAQTINVSEYIVDTGDDGKKDGAGGKAAYKDISGQAGTSPDDSILVVQRVKKDSQARAGTPSSRSAPSPTAQSGAAGAGAGGAGAGGSAAGAQTGGAERLSLVTTSKFNLLEATVNDLKDRVYGSMPKNADILEEVRSQTNLKAITDMWNTLNVQSRLDAAENGIAKLSSLVEDLAGQVAGVAGQAGVPGQSVGVGSAGQDVGTKPSALSAKSAAVGADGAGRAAGQDGATGALAAAADLQNQINRLRGDLNQLHDTVYNTIEAMGISAAGGAGAAGTGVAGAGGGTGTAGAGGATGGAGTGGAAGAEGAGGVAGSRGGAGAAGAAGALTEAADLQRQINRLRGDLNQLRDTFYNTMEALGVTPGDGTSGGVQVGVGPWGRPAGQDESQQTARTGAGGKAEAGGGAGAARGAVGERIDQLERRIAECCDEQQRKEGKLQDKVQGLRDQMEFVLKQMGMNASTDANAPQLTPDLVKDLQGLMSLFSTVQDMQAQLKQVHETALALVSEKEARQSHINTLLEQIQFLKATKMDREDVAEIMADKADLRALARKVSHDQFDMACDDLAKGLEQAIGKLNMQEALWQQALDDIQREIETKLDKMELSPVKEFFNNKLKMLQDSLKALASLRRDVEAAGAKRKLMRDVNCISCDAQVVMPMEVSSTVPALRSLPPHMSMKPYLSYELDAIRKAQAANVPQRNMHDWESIDKQMYQPKQPHKVRSETDKHLCNRYCGGSHTVTTPAQRVARLGHFVKQWGPDVLPLSSGLAAGDDGKMYKVTVENAVPVAGPGGAVDGTCTPKKTQSKDDKKSPKPIIISAECRCLEGDRSGPPK